MRVLVTGAAGFICGYLVPELLERGHEVVGVDDFSKYGRLAKSYDGHPRYRFVEDDAKDVGLLTELAADCDQVVAAAAMIGGISYFHEFAYDLLAENERILASTFDAAIAAHRDGHLERIVVLSSSWSTNRRPSSRPPRAPSSAAPRRSRPTASRSSPASTSRRAPMSSTACPTQSCGRSTALLISMGDGSDEPAVVDRMVALARNGADVVAASRYMRGGRQLGGPLLKRLMSRAAGLTLHWFAGVATHDATSNFKLYSRRFLEATTIESTAGFELALELTVKATLAGRRIAEVPTTWRDRTSGRSNFRLRKWQPHYLHWYALAFRGRLKARR